MRVVHPDPDPDILPSPEPGSSGQRGTGSRIRIRHTALYRIPGIKRLKIIPEFF
jgi:hypothetical protein